jgi:hypothetical protein
MLWKGASKLNDNIQRWHNKETATEIGITEYKSIFFSKTLGEKHISKGSEMLRRSFRTSEVESDGGNCEIESTWL